MIKKIISLFIFVLLVVSPVADFGGIKVANAATTKTAVKKSTAKKTTTKKKSKKKKITKRKERLIAEPPLITMDTAPHSPKPVAKKSTKKKKVTKKA
jgi:hypothetical protein